MCKFWVADLEKNPSIVSEAIRRGLEKFCHDRLKPAQLQAVRAILQGQDTFVNVPTGYGKSLVYQILPFCATFILERLGKATLGQPVVLIVSPLLALMQDQADKLRQVPGAKPLLLSEETTLEDDSVKNTHILASLLESSRWRKLLLNTELMGNLVAVVIDEAHCIVKW